MKLQYSLLAVPALASLCFVVSCSGDTDAPSTRTGAGGSAGSTGGTAGGGAGGTSAGSAGTAGSTAGTTGGGTAGKGGTGGGGTGGTGGTAGTAGTGGGGTGGGGTGGGGGSESLPPTFANFKEIVQLSCFGGLCHSGGENPLDMTIDDMLYTTLTTHQTEDCGPLLTPGNPAQSAVLTLVKGSCNGTDRMPYADCYDEPQGGADCLSAAEISSIEAWIAAGAPEN
jgi:hypothetical protein